MGEKEDIENMVETVKSLFNPIKTLADAIGSMVSQSDELNRSFGLGRSRIVEMNVAIADSAAGITRLGGSLDDTRNTISEIAEGSRRNVIATESQVSTLYAAYKVLGTSAGELVEDFANVGYETSQIGPNLKNSIEYIQSVGLNAKTVMKDVAGSMEQMNRFQFTDGVVGLAKMAAQASMLRFDMRQTFDLANKVLDPEGAIDVAAAFQRLGVSVGDLADPFQLMNQSINDPSGLQNSLAEVAKSFTYFDEKTKSFKINPQGVLTLREMEKQTGVSAAEMSKMGLAAADLDKRLTTVNAAGLKFGNEDDKQYLANIAKMGDKGEYVVTLTDGTKKELQNLNQEEFDELIKQQKDAPKTVEDIARSQLDWTKVMAGDLEAIANGLKFGVASSKDITTNIEGLRNISTKLTGAAQDNLPKSSQVRGLTEDALTKMKDLFDEKKSGKIGSEDFNSKLKSLEDGLQNNVRNLGGKAMETFQTILKESAKNVKGDSFIENEFRSLAKMATGEKMTNTAQQKPTLFTPINNDTTTKDVAKAYTRSGSLASSSSQTTKNINSSVDFGGTITIKVDAPAGVSDQQFKTYFESDEFKKKIYEYYNQKSKELGEKR